MSCGKKGGPKISLSLSLLKYWVIYFNHARIYRGGRGVRTPLEFAKLNVAYITGNEKISYFSYLCTSAVIHQTESILLKVGPPLEKFSGSAPVNAYFTQCTWYINNKCTCIMIRKYLSYVTKRSFTLKKLMSHVTLGLIRLRLKDSRCRV